MCTHIKDCFYFYYFSFVYTIIQNNDFCPCFLTGTSVCHFEFIVCAAHEVYPCYNAVLLDIDELVSFCYLQLALSARKINLFDLILMCNFRPFEHSCLLGFAPCKGIQDSLGFWIPHQIPNSSPLLPDSLSVELRFWIPIVSGIPNSLSCIPDSNAQDSGFHKQKFPGFQDLDSLTAGDGL